MNETHQLPIFVSWIGMTDLRTMNRWRILNGKAPALGYNDGNPDKLADKFSGIERNGENGPVRTFTDGRKAEIIYLLATNKIYKDAETFREWVARGTDARCNVVYVDVADPSDYTQVYNALKTFYENSEYRISENARRTEFHISSGTPATQAMTVLTAHMLLSGSRTFKTVEKKYADKATGQQIFEIKLPFTLTGETLSNTSSGFISDDRKIQEVAEIYGRFRNVTILLLGETGVGKSESARRIHKLSGDKGEFVIANCGELAQGDGNMFRSELFGSKKGSYTGSTKDTVGLFEKAKNGTIFLDEIAEIPLAHQQTLLRALNDRQAQRLGDNETYSIDNVRIIAATNRNLAKDVREGKFREDLYYRVAMCPVHLEPLRQIRSRSMERFDKIAKDILAKIQQDEQFSGSTLKLTDDAWEFIRSREWPGNIRQLRHVLQVSAVYAYIKNKGVINEKILKSHLFEEPIPNSSPTAVSAPENEIPSDLDKWLLEHKIIFAQRALEKCRHNTGEAARLLGISYQRLNTFINKPEFKNRGM